MTYTGPNTYKRTAGGTEILRPVDNMFNDERKVMINGSIDSQMAYEVIAQLNYLYNKDNSLPITVYLNTPGGSVTDGLMILDALNMMEKTCQINMVCLGMAASMGAVLLACGSHSNNRYILPNGGVMIHQISSGIQGQLTDILIHAEWAKVLRDKIYTNLAESTGKSFEEIERACERDNWFSAEKAVEFGLVDKILEEWK